MSSTMSLLAGGVFAGGWALGALPIGMGQEPPPGSEQHALESVRQQVAAELGRIRQRILDAERGMDHGPLVERKLTVDGSLLPALLLEDSAVFCETVQEGREPPDLLRALRVEFGESPVRSEWSDPLAPQRVARALSSWVPGPDALLACMATTSSMRAPPGEGAPLIRWTAAVEGCGSTRQTKAWAHWYEPCLESMFLDWPVAPLSLAIDWDAWGGSLSQAGVVHRESWPPQPTFNNPGDLYAVFDALRSRRAPDAEVRSRQQRVEGAPLAGDAPTDASPASTVTRTLWREDGSVVRVETWRFEEEALRSLTIEQPPLRLRHVAPHAFLLHAEVNNEPVREEEIRGETVIAFPPGGLRIIVRFRGVDATRDLLPAREGATVPESIHLEAGGVLRVRVQIEGVAAGADPAGRSRAAVVLAGWQQAADASAALRLRSMDAAERAIAEGDVVSVREELASLARLGGVEGVPQEWALANASFARRRLVRGGQEDAAAELHAWTVNAILLKGESLASHPQELSPARAALTAAIGEGLRALEQRAGELLEASPQEALEAHARAQTAARRLGLAAREVVRRAPSEADAWMEGAAPRVMEDLRALVANRVGEFGGLQRLTEAELDRACEAFAVRLGRALERPWPTDAVRTASRTTVRAAAEAAGAVARGAALARGMPSGASSAIARRAATLVRVREGLAANGLEATEPLAAALLRTPAEWELILARSEDLARRLEAFDSARLMEADRAASPLIDARFAPPESAGERLAHDLARAVAAAMAEELARSGVIP